MSKEAFLRNKVMTKAEFDKLKLPVNTWNDEQIPPLVTLTNPKEKKRKKQSIQLQSLNQSQVRSIYTVDREDFDKHMLDIMDSTMRSQKLNPKLEINQQVEPDWSTPINREKKQRQFDQPKKDILSTFREEEHEHQDFNNCQAVRLYQQLVEESLRQMDQSDERSDLNWMQSKSSSELLANVLTNKHRMNVYIRYLLHEIYLNDEAKTFNELHQEQMKHYNPDLKQAYSNILCLLAKIGKASQNDRTRSKSKGKNPTGKQGPKVSLFQNGVAIDIEPKLSATKRQQAARIRELRHDILEQEKEFQNTKKSYEQIIMNYAVSIEQLQKLEQEHYLRPQLQQSTVKMDVLHQQQEEMVRNKNHTFGMRSGRASKDSRR